jgi:hypothetical protein
VRAILSSSYAHSTVYVAGSTLARQIGRRPQRYGFQALTYLRRTFDERKEDYEYLAVYVDDIAIASKDPALLSMNLRRHISSSWRTTTYHLGCDYFRDADGTLCTAPLRYIEKMVEAYERMFGCKPKQNSVTSREGRSPRVRRTSRYGRHQEVSVNDRCTTMGSHDWRLDVATAVMSMSLPCRS